MTSSYHHIFDQFESSDKDIFRFIKGKAFTPGSPPCNWKLCITATDEAYIAKTLLDISKREDCFFVKASPSSSPKSRDQMMLGRVFLTSQEDIGALWKKLYKDRKLMCSIKDDDATQKYRS